MEKRKTTITKKKKKNKKKKSIIRRQYTIDGKTETMIHGGLKYVFIMFAVPSNTLP